MTELLSDIWTWLQPTVETVWPWVWSAALLFFNLVWIWIQIVVRLVFWGVMFLGVPAFLLGVFANGASVLLASSDESPGPIRKLIGWGLALMSLATLVLCAMIVGGLGQYTWGLVEQVTLFSDWSYSIWVKRALGLLGGCTVMGFCCSSDYASSLLELVDQRSRQINRMLIVPLGLLALLIGFVYPVAFEWPRRRVLNFGNSVVAKFTGAEIPPELKGAVFRGVVSGSTVEGRFYGYATHQELTVSFGVDTAFLAIDGLPVPCVVRGNQILVSTYRTENVWLDMSYDEETDCLLYSMKSNGGDEIFTTEGILVRQVETITDERLMGLLTDIFSP